MSAIRTFLLNQLYPRAIGGLPVLGTPAERAAEAARLPGPDRARARQMVRAHVAAASSAGFVGGLGGWITLPVTLPANVVGVALVQLHMAASCAALAGRDLKARATREEVIACLFRTDEGVETSEEAETEQRVLVKVAERGLRFVTGRALRAAAGRVTRRAGRVVPFFGGFVGAASDAYLTRKVAQHSVDFFFPAAGAEAPARRAA